MLTTLRTLALVQGLFLAGVLWFHPGNRRANRWLAAALVAFALLTLGDVLSVSGAIARVPHLAYAFDWMIFLLGPLIYRYVVALTSSERLRWSGALAHALPALLAIAALAPVYLWPADDKLRALRADLAASPRVDPLLIVAALQVGAYWFASLVRWHRFRERLKSFYSNLDALKSGWLTALLTINVVVWASWLATLLVGLRVEWFESTVTAIAIYALGYLGLRRAAVFGASDPIALAKYAKSSLSPQQLHEYRARLEQFIKLEKPFLEGELTLGELAQRLSLSSHQLSQVLSIGLSQNFYDFINRHRVAEVQRCLQDPAYADQTILDLALASGFSSKAAFNAAFKKHTGSTPSAQRRRPVPASNSAG